MAATGYPQSYAHPAEILAEIAQIAPPFAGVSYERLEGEGLQWPVPDATHPGTPLLHRQEFPLGKAPLLRVGYDPSPSLAASDGPLLLVTGRALEHYNNGSMTRRTDNRLLLLGERLEMHREGERRLEIASGDRVTVSSKFGEARATARLRDDVAPGTLFLTFHFPETGTNCVTSNVVDRIADTPEYKLTAVEVRKVVSAGAEAGPVTGKSA
jgi:predicted molibdopterin-dependent oxidoreductase YjgC